MTIEMSPIGENGKILYEICEPLDCGTNNYLRIKYVIHFNTFQYNFATANHD